MLNEGADPDVPPVTNWVKVQGSSNCCPTCSAGAGALMPASAQTGGRDPVRSLLKPDPHVLMNDSL